MKMTMAKVLAFTFCLVLLLGCQNFSWLPKKEEKVELDPKAKRNGLVKSHWPNGRLRAEIYYKNDIKHGLAKSYSKSGYLLQEVPYENGVQHGTAKMYYEDGSIRRTTDYKEGLKDGWRKSYWQSGRVSSQISYKDNLPANDLKEFMKSGKEKSSSPKLEVRGIDRISLTGEYIVRVFFSNNNKRAEFFVGELVDGKYFDDRQLRPIAQDDEGGYIIFTPPPGAFTMERIPLVGKLKTPRGNQLIRTTVFNLAIEG